MLLTVTWEYSISVAIICPKVFMKRCFMDGFVTQNMVQTIEWQVTSASHKRNSYSLKNASCKVQDGDEYVWLEFNIHMARNPSYFAKFTLLPILLLTVLVLVIFCIPPTTSDRISLGEYIVSVSVSCSFINL